MQECYFLQLQWFSWQFGGYADVGLERNWNGWTASRAAQFWATPWTLPTRPVSPPKRAEKRVKPNLNRRNSGENDWIPKQKQWIVLHRIYALPHPICLWFEVFEVVSGLKLPPPQRRHLCSVEKLAWRRYFDLWRLVIHFLYLTPPSGQTVKLRVLRSTPRDNSIYYLSLTF